MAIAEDIQPIAGLFPLHLYSEAEKKAVGAPELELNLLIDTPHRTVTGYAQVTQSTAMPILCISHVSGNVIYEAVMGPDAKIRLDLAGYPSVCWPTHNGAAPAFPRNFSATVLLDDDWGEGEVIFQYHTQPGAWMEERQMIYRESGIRMHPPLAAAG